MIVTFAILYGQALSECPGHHTSVPIPKFARIRNQVPERGRRGEWEVLALETA